MAETEEIVTFRLAPADRAAIQRLVEQGEYRNRSDFLRHAVKNALREHEARTLRARVDLELDAVDLPAHEPGRRVRQGPRARRGVNL